MKRRNFLKRILSIPIVINFPMFGFSQDSITAKESGLNYIIEVIQEDTRLSEKVPQEDIDEAISSAQRMNEILIEAIIQTGVANDKNISTADVREINDYIFNNYNEEWITLHGEDNDGQKSGFHKIVDSGAKTRLYEKNAVNRVFNGIYHLGLNKEIENRLLDEKGEKDVTVKNVAIWLDDLLREDLENGTLINSEIKETVAQTKTGLDQIVSIIYNDEKLKEKISIGAMRESSSSANEMNKIILEAIEETNAGISGEFTIDDIRNINQFIVQNYADTWSILYGIDEDSGYNRAKDKGAKTILFDRNAVNRVFGGLYNLGFETPYSKRLADENGEKSLSLQTTAQWLSTLLSDKLSNETEDLKILIPLYSYPNINEDDYIWRKLIDAKNLYPDSEIVAIVNPNNGSFREEDENFSRGIQDLVNAGIKVIGYVYTKYGSRDTQEVIDDIEAWSEIYKEYGISGIFFDETSTNSDDLIYYENLSKEARDRGFEFIVLNAGITTAQEYIDSGIANIIVTYENSNQALIENPPISYNQPTDMTNLSILIHSMEDNRVDELITFARENNFKYIYFTDDGISDDNPWDSISIYLEDEIKKAIGE